MPIIESQYELAYIIPLIGEMIDKFISDHLIYIFNKDEDGKFNLLWPAFYDGKSIDPVLEKIGNNPEYFVTDDKTIGVFPLVAENKIIGAIVADGKCNKLSETDINYLNQLTSQASITIDKANAYAEILKHASMDALTGLINRRQFEVRLRQEISVAKRKSQPLCCMMIDIDYFKKINDAYGHPAGDFILKEFAKIITEQIRDYDFAARYGGEEFCILLPATTLEETLIVAERLRKKVEEAEFDLTQFEIPGVRKISITISIGISQFSLDKDDPETLYNTADKALYKAKKSGRNQIVVFEN